MKISFHFNGRTSSWSSTTISRGIIDGFCAISQILVLPFCIMKLFNLPMLASTPHSNCIYSEHSHLSVLLLSSLSNRFSRNRRVSSFVVHLFSCFGSAVGCSVAFVVAVFMGTAGRFSVVVLGFVVLLMLSNAYDCNDHLISDQSGTLLIFCPSLRLICVQNALHLSSQSTLLTYLNEEADNRSNPRYCSTFFTAFFSSALSVALWNHVWCNFLHV